MHSCIKNLKGAKGCNRNFDSFAIAEGPNSNRMESIIRQGKISKVRKINVDFEIKWNTYKLQKGQ